MSRKNATEFLSISQNKLTPDDKALLECVPWGKDNALFALDICRKADSKCIPKTIKRKLVAMTKAGLIWQTHGRNKTNQMGYIYWREQR